MLLCRLFLCISALTSFTIAAPPVDLATNGVEARSDSKHFDVEAPGDRVLEQLERRCIKVGSYFLLVNATPWNMTLSRKVSYQMRKFNFPETIKPGEELYFDRQFDWTDWVLGTSNRIYIEGSAHEDDAGEASYEFRDLPGKPDFELKYKDGSAGIRFTKLRTLNNKRSSFHKLVWHADNNFPFIIASSETDPRNPSISPWIVSSNPPEDWMHSIYPRIACLSLRELAIPGTHNSGMSRFHGRSFMGLPRNSKTQMLNVSAQLKYGVRWLDIRPTLTKGKWATGHFSFGAGNWHGGNGEYLKDIIDGLNDFTSRNKELIIVNLNHGLNTDTFRGNKHARMTQVEWDWVMTRLERINYRVENRSYVRDLTKYRVSKFIEDRPAVIIIVDDLVDKRYPRGVKGPATLVPVNVSEFAKKGFFTRSQFPLFDEYANTGKQKKMAADQLTKMKKRRKRPKSKMFLFSWFLTQYLHPVLPNARDANRALIELLWPAMSPSTYPNIISVDAYPADRDIAALAMAINYHFAPQCNITSPQ
ncbi:hypothetical protein FPRO06_11014 [Fusarium proliferatum]|nr:hypothetical protein FPRO06_11014 [Fusarium proliferatum]